MQVKKILKGGGWLILIVFMLAILAFVGNAVGPNGTSLLGHTETFSDTVTDIYEGGEKDVVFALKNHKGTYYINRGLQNGLHLDSLKKQMLNGMVTVSYCAPTTHINELAYDGRIIYSELKK